MPPKSRKSDEPRSVKLHHRDPNHAAGVVFATSPRQLNDLVVGSGYRIDGGQSLAAATEYLAENVPADAEPGAATKTEATTTTTSNAGGSTS